MERSTRRVVRTRLTLEKTAILLDTTLHSTACPCTQGIFFCRRRNKRTKHRMHHGEPVSCLGCGVRTATVWHCRPHTQKTNTAPSQNRTTRLLARNHLRPAIPSYFFRTDRIYYRRKAKATSHPSRKNL